MPTRPGARSRRRGIACSHQSSEHLPPAPCGRRVPANGPPGWVFTHHIPAEEERGWAVPATATSRPPAPGGARVHWTRFNRQDAPSIFIPLSEGNVTPEGTQNPRTPGVACPRQGLWRQPAGLQTPGTCITCGQAQCPPGRCLSFGNNRPAAFQTYCVQSRPGLGQ